MKTIRFTIALMMVVILCACDNKAKFVGTWQSDPVSLNDEGLKGDVVDRLTLNEDGSLTSIMNVKGIVSEKDMGVDLNVSMNVTINGTWKVEGDGINFDYDETSIKGDNISMTCENAEMNAALQEAMKSPETKKQMIEEMQKSFASQNCDGIQKVISIESGKMVLQDKDNTKVTYHK